MEPIKTILASMFVAVFLMSCANKNVIVLLPGSEGKTGRILVSNRGGELLLAEPKQATDIASADAAPSTPFPMSDERIQAAFGEALSALPQPPVHFVLYFRSGTAELTEESRKLLDEVLSTTGSRKSTDVSVVGHTDRVGSREANYSLGLERTGMISRMLVSQGIDRDFIDASSHGEDNPLIKTDDNLPEPRNRRVEIVVR
jgi:outer membrane protein OmpA-like peptidoglycan-associated protein